MPCGSCPLLEGDPQAIVSLSVTCLSDNQPKVAVPKLTLHLIQFFSITQRQNWGCRFSSFVGHHGHLPKVAASTYRVRHPHRTTSAACISPRPELDQHSLPSHPRSRQNHELRGHTDHVPQKPNCDDILDELFNIKTTNYQSLTAFVLRLDWLGYKLRERGIEMDDHTMQSLVLKGMEPCNKDSVDTLRQKIRDGLIDMNEFWEEVGDESVRDRLRVRGNNDHLETYSHDRNRPYTVHSPNHNRPTPKRWF
ncbi:hypothetical protein QBC45DRAFT_9243 [Copromyces sp. CBS 386.78]|nr:hypothetical protein QBC45DRAFT_9243 [Copromyces sp. CBS 386.78]